MEPMDLTVASASAPPAEAAARETMAMADMSTSHAMQRVLEGSMPLRSVMRPRARAQEVTVVARKKNSRMTQKKLLRQKLLKLPRILQIRSLVRRKLRKLRLLPQKKSPKKTLLKKRRQKLLRLEMVKNFWHPVLIICLPEPYS